MRQKIDYGIDLGTTNSAIARMEDGEAFIIKSDDNQMDTTPSIVAFNKKQAVFVGLSAKNALERESVSFHRNRKKAEPNGYQEFKRTMGTDHQYTSSNMQRSYTSEELSAEVLKKLKGYIRDEEVTSAVITVPAMFRQSQLDATQRAAELAGFSYCELLQEPIAASIAYGVKANATTGYWLVFDFGGGTFDAALMHVEEGIMKVVDTEGDNHLGGKNLDNAIVDQLLIPELQKQCELSSTLENESTKKLLQDALKKYAEEAKIALSSKEKWSYFLEDLGEDDDGEEIQADLDIGLEQYEKVVSPIFQRAIDIVQDVLKRNGLSGRALESLILVGGPTFQQTLRRMLKEQITENVDTSIDPMTAVAKGAALFASTKDIPGDLQKRDSSKAQLSLKYPETTVETHENLGIRINRDQSTANLPETFVLEIIRGDSGWSSGKVIVEGDVEIIELMLNEGKTNQFNIKLSGPDGSNIPCEPSSITIIQGMKIANATLPYSVGIEVYDTVDNKQGVYPLAGLEKNKTLPAKGKGSFKTMKDIRPGVKEDQLLIPIYELSRENAGSRAILNTFFGKFAITGQDISAFLPAGSEVEVTLNIDASRRGKLSVYLPSLDESFDIVIDSTIEKDVKKEELQKEIVQAKATAQRLANEGNSVAEKQLEQLDEAEQVLNDRGHERSSKEEVKAKLQESLIELDKQEEAGEWPKVKQELQETLNHLIMQNKRYGNAQTNRLVEESEEHVRQVIAAKDIQSAKKLESQLSSMACELQGQDISFWVGAVYYLDESFDEIKWTNRAEAYRGVQNLKQLLNMNPNKDRLEQAVWEVVQLMSPESKAAMQNVNNDLLRR
ncbi:Hsp70 family protein [Acinetobacter haemolyticus]|uniref:Hsp70 family protein n=1 Tax=Acinetobacter haemolyticus TaxID=29430 RepID=UPI001372EC28|nr:Hsp70 family protein [Acinetobacter haemolyticus]NAR90885.1 Hsp70 family protein [Acinetobacter haemolyticus]